MGITFSGRHYWSKVTYDNFYDLQSNGSLLRSDYEQFHDLTFDAFTIDAVYRWRFAPGSDISIVWKRNISGVHQNKITDYSRYTYFEGVRELDRLPQNNSLSLRVTYFLDYAMNIQSKFQRNK